MASFFPVANRSRLSFKNISQCVFVQISQIIIYLPLVSKEREREYKVIKSLTTFRENLKKNLANDKVT